jgi:GT2 family glycosyltransferase
MELTVCICTHNRPAYVKDCLAGLDRQTTGRERFAVLIVDSASAAREREELAQLAASDPTLRLLRLSQPGVSAARNAGAWAARTPYIAYIDDDAIPAPDWVASILVAIQGQPRRPALIGGRILPKWEAPLPVWWPRSLRGVLSIIEAEGSGEYRTAALPEGLEPYAANMVVHVLSLLSVGGFGTKVGRHGKCLLSDEEVQLAWKLQDAGHSVRYESSIVVEHQIQAGRLTPQWLLSRLFWQGASTVVTRQMLGYEQNVGRELPRRLLVAAICAPAQLLPANSTRMIWARWRFAYAAGFIRAAFGWDAARAARKEDLAKTRLEPGSIFVSDPA